MFQNIFTCATRSHYYAVAATRWILLTFTDFCWDSNVPSFSDIIRSNFALLASNVAWEMSPSLNPCFCKRRSRVLLLRINCGMARLLGRCCSKKSRLIVTRSWVSQLQATGGPSVTQGLSPIEMGSSIISIWWKRSLFLLPFLAYWVLVGDTELLLPSMVMVRYCPFLFVFSEDIGIKSSGIWKITLSHRWRKYWDFLWTVRIRGSSFPCTSTAGGSLFCQ